jgi:hypothetical protein
LAVVSILESCTIKAIGGALSLQDVYDPPSFHDENKTAAEQAQEQ